MKRYLALNCLGLGLMVSPLFGCIGPKIGIIDITNTLSTTPAGKRAKEAFEKTRKTKQAVLDKQQEELQNENDDLEKQKLVLKPEVFEDKRTALEKKRVELQQTYMKLEREIVQDRAKLIQDLLKQAETKIAALAKVEGVSLILDQSAILWADPSVDLTQKLNAEMQ